MLRHPSSDVEWSDGTLPAGVFNPPANLAARADRRVKLAHDVGMRYVLLTTKHIDGFCLGDSTYPDYDIGNPP